MNVSVAVAAPRRARMVIAIVMLFIAGLSTTFGIASFWTERAILDENTWVSTSKAIVNNPKEQNDVASAIATRIVDIVGVDDAVAEALPIPFSGFSGSLTKRVTELVAIATVQVVKTDAFAAVWEAAVRGTHNEFVHAVDGSTRFTRIDSEGVSLDLGSSFSEIQKQLNERGISLLDNVDASSIDLTIPLIDAPGLQQIQTWVHALRIGSIVFPAVAVLGIVAGLLIARRRSFAAIAGAVGSLLGVAFIAVFTATGRNQAIEEIAGGVLGVGSATVIVDEVLSGLNHVLVVTSAVSALMLVAASCAMVWSSRKSNVRPSDTDGATA